MITLKIADKDDYSTVLEFSLKFLKESPYRDLPYDIAKIDSFIRLFLEGDKNERICILALSKGIPIGIIAGHLSQALFSSELVAAEVMWWITPEFRGRSKAALELLGAFEHWASMEGSSFIQMQSLGALNGSKVGSLLERFGYEPKEVSYLKEIV